MPIEEFIDSVVPLVHELYEECIGLTESEYEELCKEFKREIKEKRGKETYEFFLEVAELVRSHLFPVSA